MRRLSRLAVWLVGLRCFYGRWRRRGRTGMRATAPSVRSRRAGLRIATSWVVTDSRGNPLASTSPTGLSPATIKSVYGLPTNTTASPLPGAGETTELLNSSSPRLAEADRIYPLGAVAD
jgi:hypothetical protein